MFLNKCQKLAIYIIPPDEIRNSLAQFRSHVAQELGSFACLNFPIHITVKGLFTPNIKKPYVALRDEIEKITINIPLFQLGISRVHFNRGVLFFEILDRKNNIQALVDSVNEILLPYIADDELADFNQTLYNLLPPHITLAFLDIPPNVMEKISYLVSNTEIVSPRFVVRSIELMEFSCDDWSKSWWETISWKVLDSFPLKWEELKD